MQKYLNQLITFCFSVFCFMQTAVGQLQEVYVRAKVQFDAQHTVAQLAALGIEADHGNYTPGRGLTSEFSQTELKLIQNVGFKTHVLIPDMFQWHKAHVDDPARDRSGCAGGGPTKFDYPTPVNFTPGTYAGFYRYQEMLDMLDSMVAKYPNLITVRKPITDTIRTHENRPLFWVRMSDNPNQDESEPEVLYTALHHAREPNSMSQMLFYMWYLLENYATNDEARYILNNVELYFVPCINPDGYLRNETEAPDGGGFWRKNMRDNGDGTKGVDLNRNYGYQWGYDNIGSSPETVSEVYRGTAAFSEPETRMMRVFCDQHQFQFALNYHTSGNLLIYPWAWSDMVAKPEFVEYGNLLTEENKYRSGIATQTVGYQVNGSSDDYMYGGKNIFAFTPEVGTLGFWPPISEIEQFTKANVRMNLLTAQLPLKLAIPLKKEIEITSSTQGKAIFDLKNIGLSAATFQVEAVPNSLAVQAITNGQLQVALTALESKPIQINFTLKPGIQSGDTIRIRVIINNGFYNRTETIERIYYGPSLQLFNSPMSSLNGWTSADPAQWQLTTEEFFSAPTSCTDTPNGDYLDDSFSITYLSDPIIIPTTATSARLRYKAKWSLEEGYDMAQVFALVNGNFTPLCATSSVFNVNNAVGIPAYSGYNMDNWSDECIDLSDYKGQTLDQLGFLLDSDELIADDGFYFDDVVLEYNSVSGTVQIPLDGIQTMSITPNPATQQTRISWKGLSGPAEWIKITDASGHEVLTYKITKNSADNADITIQSLVSGTYQVTVHSTSGKQIGGKLTVQK
jgi:carboxypeptidase T